MPTHKGVYRKGKKFYGAKWYQRKTYVTKLFDTAAEAAEAREELIRILNKGVQPDKKNVTITDFIKLFLKKYLLPKQNVQRISINAFERNMRNSIIPFIGNMKLKGLTPEIMQDLQNKLLAKHASSSAAIIMNQFKRVVKRAVIWRYISYDPTLDLDSITVEIEKPDILTPEQVLLILNHESIDLRQRTIIGLGGFGGLRESEIMAIKKTKINFNTKSIKIDLQYSQGELKKPKKGSERTIPILPDLEVVLKQWFLKSDSQIWLFEGMKGKPLNADNWIHYYFKPILKELGLPIINFHALRHGFNKMLHDWGVPPREVMQIMGHKTRKMTFETYDRESPQRLVEVTRKISFNNAFLRNSLRNS